jgi:hypothetical protein
MYRSLPEIWEGMTKNTFAASELNGWYLLGFGLYAALTAFLPWLWPILGVLIGWPPLWAYVLPVAQIVSVSAARVIADALTGRVDPLATLLIPLSFLLAFVIAVRSWMRAAFRQSTPWRGRDYTIWKDRKGEADKPTDQ